MTWPMGGGGYLVVSSIMYSCMCTVPSAWRVHSCSAASRRGDHGHRIRNLTVTGRATHEKDPPRSFAEPCSSCVPLHSLHRARALSLSRARARSLSLISCRFRDARFVASGGTSLYTAISSRHCRGWTWFGRKLDLIVRPILFIPSP